jgi:four helix bundle protein
MQDFRNLVVWQKAHQLALHTYRITNDFPRDEVFGLRNMMRKISIDIPAYIAEGAAKPNDSEFARCLSAALGFANRLEYYALMAQDLEFFGPEAYRVYVHDLVEVKKMMGGFNRRLNV